MVAWLNKVHRQAAVTIAVPLFVLASTRDAVADPEACAKAYESAQAQRHESKLIEARRDLVTCSQDACPAVLRKDCVAWLSEVEAEVPAIAIRVRVDGCDRTDAKIEIDGALVPSAADGRPIEVNPGPHVIAASVDSHSRKQDLVVTTKDKHRAVTMAFGTAVLCGPSGQPSPPPRSTADAPQTTRPVSPLVYVLGGVGIVGLGVGTGFGISAWSQKGTLDDCKGACISADVDTMRRTFLVSDIAGVVGLVSLAVATVLYVTR